MSWLRVLMTCGGMLLLLSATVACGPECPEGQTKCGEVCINTKTDRKNCGACGTACADGQVCNAGKCAVSCQQGLLDCGGACVDRKTNGQNCGACGVQCKAGQFCNQGKCETTCVEGQTACNDACFDTQTSNQHCGACGKACEQGESCVSGKCEVSCPKGQTACEGKCVDTKANRDNCGGCGTKCDAGKVCSAGACELSCQKDFSNCSGACVDTKVSKAHCGSCGKACNAGETCKSGTCKLDCASGFEACSGVCVNKMTSRAHCGTCAKACVTGEICDKGQCVPNCPKDFTACSNVCVNTQSDAKNCGGCGKACKEGELCQSGKCALFCQKGFKDCSGACVDIQRDAKNCGACGTACQSGQACVAGKCEAVATCGGRETSCGGQCANVQRDAKNCGACGTACKVGDACVDGKCAPCRNCPAWAESVGAFNFDLFEDITVDSKGNVLAIGRFNKVAQAGGIRLNSQGGDDIMIVKLNAAGRVLWAVSAGGSSTDYGYGIATDGKDNVYVTGGFQGKAVFGSLSLTSAGGYDVYVAKLDSTGKFLWAKGYGSTSSDYGYDIAADTNGNTYITGRFFGTTKFDQTSLVSKGSGDIFLVKLDATGKVAWAGGAGSSSNEEGESVAVDSAGNVYLAGRFYSSITWGSTTLKSTGSSDVFVAKFSPLGALQWAASGGGTSLDYAYALAVDAAGNAYITGRFSSSGATFGSTKLTSNGNYDVFVAKVDSTGKWGWSVNAGGGSADYAYGIGVNSKGTVYVAGYFSTTGKFGALSLSSAGSSDVFLMEVDSTGKVAGALRMGGTGSDYGYNLHVDAQDNLYIGGYFYDIANFGLRSIITSGSANAFVAKYNKPSASLCPQQGYSVCSNACVKTDSDPKNCGGCGKTCKTGELCSASRCVQGPAGLSGLFISEVNVGNPDYVVLKNTSTKDHELLGMEVRLYSSFASPDVKFTLPKFLLKAGASVYLVESSPKTGELKCPSIPYTSSSPFAGLLCVGACDVNKGSNVIDAVVIGKTSRTLPSGITFSGGGVANMTFSQESSNSYVRIGRGGKNPTFLKADWAIRAKTR